MDHLIADFSAASLSPAASHVHNALAPVVTHQSRRFFTFCVNSLVLVLPNSCPVFRWDDDESDPRKAAHNCLLSHGLLVSQSPLPENLWEAGDCLSQGYRIVLVEVNQTHLVSSSRFGMKVYSLANRSGLSKSNKSLFVLGFGPNEYISIFNKIAVANFSFFTKHSAHNQPMQQALTTTGLFKPSHQSIGGGAAGHVPMHPNLATTSLFTPPLQHTHHAHCVHGHAICNDLHSRGMTKEGKRIAGHGFAVLIEYNHGGRVVYLVTSVGGKLRPIAGSFEECDNLCWFECMNRELFEEAGIHFSVPYILTNLVKFGLVGRTPAFLLRTSEDISRTVLNRIIQDPARRAKGHEFREIDGVAMVDRNMTVYKPQQGIATAPSEFLTSLMRTLL